MRYVIYRSPENVVAVPGFVIRESPPKMMRVASLTGTSYQPAPLRDPATFSGPIPPSVFASLPAEFDVLGEDGVLHNCLAENRRSVNLVASVSGIVTESQKKLEAPEAASIVANAYARKT